MFIDDLECNVTAAAELGMEVIQCLDPIDAADQVVQLLLSHHASDEVLASP
jgi:hypothetical protein